MGRLLDKIRKYIETATPEQLAEDRERTLSLKGISPCATDYVDTIIKYKDSISDIKCIKTVNNIFSNPEYSLDFLFC